ncbi:MAG: hypothetical protein K2N94_10130 [Lachnospiraceae bacterium]|nr:hypothetical protein [Lachnospiraceae bacterium]
MIPFGEKLAEFKRRVGTKNICLLLLACGLLLLSFSSGIFSPGRDKEPENAAGEPKDQVTAVRETEKTELELWEEKLKTLLSGVKGVGKTEVMITLSDGGEKVVLKDVKTSTESLNEADGVGGTRVDLSSEKTETTVYGAGSVPFVTQELSARVAGILIVCEGGGRADVALGIVSAVEALFGVPAHRIVVLEMK